MNHFLPCRKTNSAEREGVLQELGVLPKCH